MLKVSNLTVTRAGKELISNLNFELNRGQLIHMTGANGSGKSTLASVIAGDLPAVGEITFDGSKDYSIKELAKLRGALLQELEIEFPITVAEYVALGGSNSGEVLSNLELEDIAERRITQVSQGQLQRAMLAQLIVQDPALYILDEPFSAQDQHFVEVIIGELRRLKSEGRAIILINHIDLKLGDLVDITMQL